MRFIPTRVHGVIDYLAALLWIVLPWLFGFARGGAETLVPVGLGVGVVVYSLLTRYELGLVPVLPITAHLGLDLLGGVFLALSPWLFGFSSTVWVPHLLFGLFSGFAALSTRLEPTRVRI